MESNVVTIDGKRGSGKSRLASGLRDLFGCDVLDIGPLFRLIAWCVYSGKASSINSACRVLNVENLKLSVRLDRGSSMAATHIELEGLGDQSLLWDPELDTQLLAVSESHVAAATVKTFAQRAIGSRPAIVVGRNTGSQLFPEAPLKIELIADDTVREKRKMRQFSEMLQHSGALSGRHFEIERAEPRQVSTVCTDVVRLDTTLTTPDRLLESVGALIQHRLGWSLKHQLRLSHE